MNRSRRLFNISTGYRVIDCLFPVAHGQRELIIGDRQTGKSTLALTSTINQISMAYEYPVRYTMIGIYVATAQKCTNIMRFFLYFRWIKVQYSHHFCTPALFSQWHYSSYHRCQEHVFRNSPETMAEPHSYHMMILVSMLWLIGNYRYSSENLQEERLILQMFLSAFKVTRKSLLPQFYAGSGTLACFPIIETLSNDLSAYVATNVISITDGQLYLDSSLLEWEYAQQFL